MIAGFANNVDRLHLRAFGFDNAQQVKLLARNTPDGLLIDLASVDGGTIILESFQRAALDGADMLL